MQYVEKKFMEVDYNMLVQNYVFYNMLSRKITLWGRGAMVKALALQCGSKKFKFSYLQPRLPWLLR